MNNQWVLSPLDGRYSSKTQSLCPYLSEGALIKFRIQVEIQWLLSLSRVKIINISPESSQSLLSIGQNFTDVAGVKSIEKTTNHDVKAVEYWLRNQLLAHSSLKHASEFIHFACTSEDINNLAYALMVKSAREEVMIPALNKLHLQLKNMSHQYASVAMISRTHGQKATPTTVGKELANFSYRLNNAISNIKECTILAKFNGAVGNFNAHHAAYPNINWEEISREMIESLGLTYNPYTTQIEPHDWMANLFDAFMRLNTTLIDLNRDMWGYISLGYFNQKTVAGEIGSSTMPHKVNPINFEGSEGSLGVANALFSHFSQKLPISRWQRDLTDSTVLRNIGVAFGYSLVAYDACLQGLLKLDINQENISKDLDNAWELLAEPIQTVMRKHGVLNAYEQLKDMTRGVQISKESIHQFISSLNIPEEEKSRLLELTPASYIGYAISLANDI